MPPKFSKALLAAGLAAALVGCGGGSSTTTMAPPPDESTETTADAALDGTYATVKSLVDGLAADPTAEKIKEAKDARAKFRDQLIAAKDVSPEKRADLNSKLNSLATTIDAAETAMANASLDSTYETAQGLANALTEDSTSSAISQAKAERTKLENQLRAANDLSPEKRVDLNNKLTALAATIDTAEKAMKAKTAASTLATNRNKAVLNADFVSLGTWPANAIDSPSRRGEERTGNDFTISSIRDNWNFPRGDWREGWSGTNYPQVDGATDHGRTFMKEVTKVTPEQLVDWEDLANFQSKNPGDYLGEYVSMTPQGRDIPGIVGSRSTVFIDIENRAPGRGLATTDKVLTKIHKSHLAAPNLENLPVGITSAQRGNFTNDRKHFNPDMTEQTIGAVATLNAIGTETETAADILGINQDGIMLADLFGRTGFFTCTPETIAGDCGISFNAGGFLEVSFSVAVPSGSEVLLSFVPFDRTADLDSHDIVYRQGNEDNPKTSTIEFAYWSDSVDRSSGLEAFARGGAGEMVFDAVTDMPEKLTGSADYVGLAGGYYAMGTESSGEFTAEAMLTANFESNQVSGSIDDFQSVTNDDDISAWKLDLAAADFADNTFGNAFTGNTLGYIKGDENNKVRGQKWAAGFHGKANPGGSTELVPDMTNDYPEAVIGTFKGSFPNNGQVVGGFGTELAEGSKE